MVLNETNDKPHRFLPKTQITHVTVMLTVTNSMLLVATANVCACDDRLATD